MTGVGSSELFITQWSRVPLELLIFVPKAYYRVHRSVTLVSEVLQSSILHPTPLFKILFNIIIPSMPSSSECFYFLPKSQTHSYSRSRHGSVSRLSLTAEVRVRSQARPCGFRDGGSGTGIGLKEHDPVARIHFCN
jgi:hypothetical protein